MLVALIALIAIALLEGLVIYRAVTRMLQFDSILQRIVDTLDSYSTDLIRMSSADIDGILVDHPEVLRFHQRNMKARAEVMGAIEDVTRETPRRRKAPAPPRPDME